MLCSKTPSRGASKQEVNQRTALPLHTHTLTCLALVASGLPAPEVDVNDELEDADGSNKRPRDVCPLDRRQVGCEIFAKNRQRRIEARASDCCSRHKGCNEADIASRKVCIELHGSSCGDRSSCRDKSVSTG